MILTCSSVAQVLKSTNTKTQEPKTLPSCPNVSDDKDQSQILDSQKETAIVGSDASNNSVTKGVTPEQRCQTVLAKVDEHPGVSHKTRDQLITSTLND